MDRMTFAILMGTIAFGNAVVIVLFNKKRQMLDLTKAEDVKRDKSLKLFTMILPMETVLLAVVLYFLLVANPA